MSSALEKLEALHGPAGEPPRRHRGGVIGGALAALTFLAAKGKAVILILAKLKIWMFWKTAATMLLAIWVYAQNLGWGLAAGLVGLIFVHEAGHVWAAHRVGVPVSAPMFVPFVGAYVKLRGQPRSTYDAFIIAAGGPLLGSAGALVCLALATAWVEAAPLLRTVGYFALILNLFNLTPFWILDGARMIVPVTPRDGVIGSVLAALVLIVTAVVAGHLNPIGLIAAAVCLWRTAAAALRARRARRARSATALERLTAHAEAEAAPAGDVSPTQRRTAALVYFGLLAFLGGATQLLGMTILPAS